MTAETDGKSSQRKNSQIIQQKQHGHRLQALRIHSLERSGKKQNNRCGMLLKIPQKGDTVLRLSTCSVLGENRIILI